MLWALTQMQVRCTGWASRVGSSAWKASSRVWIALSVDRATHGSGLRGGPPSIFDSRSSILGDPGGHCTTDPSIVHCSIDWWWLGSAKVPRQGKLPSVQGRLDRERHRAGVPTSPRRHRGRGTISPLGVCRRNSDLRAGPRMAVLPHARTPHTPESHTSPKERPLALRPRAEGETHGGPHHTRGSSRGRLSYRRGRPRDVGSVEVYVLVKPVEVRAYRRLRMWAVRHPEMMD